MWWFQWIASMPLITSFLKFIHDGHTSFSKMMYIHHIHKWWTPIIFIFIGHPAYSLMMDIHNTWCPKNALSECCRSHSELAQSQAADTPCVWKLIFGHFLLRLSLVKSPQVIFMVKFSPSFSVQVSEFTGEQFWAFQPNIQVFYRGDN